MKKQYVTPTVEVTVIEKSLMTVAMSIDPSESSDSMGARGSRITDWDDDYND